MARRARRAGAASAAIHGGLRASARGPPRAWDLGECLLRCGSSSRKSSRIQTRCWAPRSARPAGRARRPDRVRVLPRHRPRRDPRAEGRRPRRWQPGRTRPSRRQRPRRQRAPSSALPRRRGAWPHRALVPTAAPPGPLLLDDEREKLNASAGLTIPLRARDPTRAAAVRARHSSGSRAPPPDHPPGRRGRSAPAAAVVVLPGGCSTLAGRRLDASEIVTLETGFYRFLRAGKLGPEDPPARSLHRSGTSH